MKQINERRKIKGHVRAVLRDKDGKIKQVHEADNTITVLFDAVTADIVATTPALVKPGWMAVGTVSGGKTTASIQLEGLIAGSNNAITSETLGTGIDDNDIVYVGDWAAGDGTGTIIEAGMFNVAACTSGMLAYDESMNIVKGASDTLEITWTITWGAS